MNQAKVNLVLPVTTDTGNKQYLYLIGNIARQCQTIVITINEVNDNEKKKLSGNMNGERLVRKRNRKREREMR